MENKLDIITIGESLIELSTSNSLTTAESLDKYYGGDTLTTAITALKLGSKVGYISRIGMDCFKEYLLESWQEAGLDISHVKPVQGINGLYMLALGQDCSEKQLYLYRRKTAATNLSIEDISTDYIQGTSVLYTTGITQSLSISAREAILKAYRIAKENNILTAYDPNYKSPIWSVEEAKEAFDEISEYINVLFINTKNDLKLITESNSIDNIIKNLWDKGITTVIIKSSQDRGYYTGYNGKIEFVKYYSEEITDNTGAGDAFNGGVLHGLASGMQVFKAVNLGAVTAGLQVRKIGAIKSLPTKEEVYRIFKGQND